VDFVVAGFGMGAILALVGFTVWELFGNEGYSGLYWKVRAGISLMATAVALWIVTIVGLVAEVGDSTGWQLVGLTVLCGLAASTAAVWSLHRFPHIIIAGVGGQRSNQAAAGDTDNGWDTSPEWVAEPDTAPPGGNDEPQQIEIPESAKAATPDSRQTEVAEVIRENVPTGADETNGTIPGHEDDQVRLTFGDQVERADFSAGEFESPLLADLEPVAGPGDRSKFRSALLNELGAESDPENGLVSQNPVTLSESQHENDDASEESEPCDAVARQLSQQESLDT
jgi:hypothetical protein